MKRLATLALLAASVFPNLGAYGVEILRAGDPFPEFESSDQHDSLYRYSAEIRTVLIAFDMSTGKAANRLLASKGAAFLGDRKAVFVSNIYGMPRVGRFFALPKMRKYPHRIVLADTPNLLSRFPRKDARVTVIRMNERAVIESIQFWDPAAEALEHYLE